MMLLLMSGVRLWSGRSSEAITSAADALTLFEGINDRFGMAQATATVGRAMVTAGRIPEGLRVLQEAIDHHPVFDDAEEPDQLRLLLGVGLAGSAVQIGDAHLAQDVVNSAPTDGLEPKTIGHGDGLVADALGLLQRGRVEAAVERVLPVVELEGHGDPSPYAQSVLALAMAAAGKQAEVDELADQVIHALRATYLDKMNARLASLLSRARLADRSVVDDFAVLATDLDQVDDPVAQSIVALAAAEAYSVNGWPEAIDARRHAELRLDGLGIRAQGWRTLFAVALAGAPAADAPRSTIAD